jgi:cytochrome c peroxidase
MFRLILSSIVVMMFFFVSCTGDGNKPANTLSGEEESALLARAKTYFKPLPVVAENPDNPLSDEKITLGKRLYFDRQLSKEGNISCNSCHNLETFGVDNLPVSPGDDGTLGTRNSPTVFNAALHASQFWDGRAKDVEEQAGMPVTNPVEMSMPDETVVVERLRQSDIYPVMFAAAYPEEADPVSFENMKKAIGAFERTLITPARFDDYLNGNYAALSGEEKRGMETFINTGCIACHKGATLGGDILQKFALFGNYWDYTGSKTIDKGKAENTKNPADEFIFKVPSLRNIVKTAPYIHDGSMSDLAGVIRVMGKAELNKDLTEQEVQQILTFLSTLTGDIPQETKKDPFEGI